MRAHVWLRVRASFCACVRVCAVGVDGVRDKHSIHPRLVAIRPDLKHKERIARDIPADCGRLT